MLQLMEKITYLKPLGLADFDTFKPFRDVCAPIMLCKIKNSTWIGSSWTNVALSHGLI
jgi:hypothetical protein